MQKFLNEEIESIKKSLQKHTFILALFILYITLAISLLISGIYCNIYESCSYDQRVYILTWGMILSITIITFILIPICLRLILNCIYTKKIIDNPIINRRILLPFTKRPILKIVRSPSFKK